MAARNLKNDTLLRFAVAVLHSLCVSSSRSKDSLTHEQRQWKYAVHRMQLFAEAAPVLLILPLNPPKPQFVPRA